MPRALLDIPERKTVSPAPRQRGQVLGDGAGAEPVRRGGLLLVREMNAVAGDEHLHLVPLFDRGSRDQ